MNIVLISSIILLIILILIIILITQTNKPLPRQIVVGGCSGTLWGCCPDEVTPKYDPQGTNCRRPHPNSQTTYKHIIGGCESTRYGCCPGSSIASNKNGSNC